MTVLHTLTSPSDVLDVMLYNQDEGFLRPEEHFLVITWDGKFSVQVTIERVDDTPLYFVTEGATRGLIHDGLISCIEDHTIPAVTSTAPPVIETIWAVTDRGADYIARLRGKAVPS